VNAASLALLLALARSGEFNTTDTGIGGRVAWNALPVVSAEAEMTWFNRGRVEGLFGVTAGPRFGRVRPFVKLRPGFLRFPHRTIACILIFPPPLSCQLAEGRTLFALDLGGGVEVFAGPRAFVRVDAGDRLLKYPGPSFRQGRVAQDDFFSHDFRVSAGAGVTF
jgi:hypothetical protein